MGRVTDFDPIVRAHQGAVRTFLRRLTRNTALADELAQDTFLKAFRSSQRLSEVKNIRAWLLRIAYRRFVDEYRRETRRRDLSDQGFIPAETATTDKAAQLDIADAMNALPPERRACAMLCLAWGHSHANAAEITGLPLGTVKSHVTRAKSALKESLSAYQGSIS